ncbi:phosphonate metabolism protein/1,5-bisphosphokinase (PRPP-forming) PhnN [Microbacterium sp. A82]|uniref:phosphonate metabolism protein/1,5-bisphosphokinase (PRPP-forming) PhnN n=1 Tax=Microbacterium sp. A82 TaxID=3450452 RepID=UPI003F30975E
MTGVFVAVVGPSGAGKDAVIDCARDHFAGEGAVIFPQRVITRPAGEGEDHAPVSADEFAALERAGAFVLRWEAHGLRYGIPASVSQAVHAGATAVVNISRTALAELTAKFPHVRAVRVTVPDEVRRARILARGRENSAEALARLNRADPAPGERVDLEIVNDGPLMDAGAALIAFLDEVLTPSAPRERLVLGEYR